MKELISMKKKNEMIIQEIMAMNNVDVQNTNMISEVLYQFEKKVPLKDIDDNIGYNIMKFNEDSLNDEFFDFTYERLRSVSFQYTERYLPFKRLISIIEGVSFNNVFHGIENLKLDNIKSKKIKALIHPRHVQTGRINDSTFKDVELCPVCGLHPHIIVFIGEDSKILRNIHKDKDQTGLGIIMKNSCDLSEADLGNFTLRIFPEHFELEDEETVGILNIGENPDTRELLKSWVDNLTRHFELID